MSETMGVIPRVLATATAAASGFVLASCSYPQTETFDAKVECPDAAQGYDLPMIPELVKKGRNVSFYCRPQDNIISELAGQKRKPTDITVLPEGATFDDNQNVFRLTFTLDPSADEKPRRTELEVIEDRKIKLPEGVTSTELEQLFIDRDE